MQGGLFFPLRKNNRIHLIYFSFKKKDESEATD